jgi:hypothetical protein
MLYSEKRFGYCNVGCVAQQSQNTRERLLDENIEQVQSKYSDLKSKIGVFEGHRLQIQGTLSFGSSCWAVFGERETV